MRKAIKQIRDLLGRIYGAQGGALAWQRIAPLIENFPARKRSKKAYFTEKDAVLITYGDTLRAPGELPLTTFRRFAVRYLKGLFSTIHFLPFFPYSSDDGFAVIDFFNIDPHLGTWHQIAEINQDFDLMIDYVVNHFSAKSQWLTNYLADRTGFEEFAIAVDPATNLSMVARPRALPLLTPFLKPNGQSVHLWTTFSADQIDFNYKSLAVLEKMIDILLYYVSRGATILRLDAIAYLWKEIGTDCLHRPETHLMVKLFRAILDLLAPDVILLTETNVPHHENIRYFGNGNDEAQMVYNFTLPPLLYHSFLKQDATALSEWARGLPLASASNAFFNFSASHDGIGMRPLEGILPASEQRALVAAAQACGGEVSYKRNPDGSQSPYELNITFVDAIIGNETAAKAQKFLASQAIQYALPGVPGTYIHSLLGSCNWRAGVKSSGRARTINRQKLQVQTLVSELKDPGSFRARVLNGYRHLVKIRCQQAAFHPKAGFEILNLDPGVFAIRRFAGPQVIHALTNVTARTIPLGPTCLAEQGELRDLLTGQRYTPDSLVLAPFEYLWLSPGCDA